MLRLENKIRATLHDRDATATPPMKPWRHANLEDGGYGSNLYQL
jgi:hypothetical protein